MAKKELKLMNFGPSKKTAKEMTETSNKKSLSAKKK